MAKKLLGFQKRFDELCYNKFACTKIANAKSGSGEDHVAFKSGPS